MARRFFYTVPDCVKYRIIFENKDTVYGANERNEYRLFRKNSGKISFSKREALRSYINTFLEKEFEEKRQVAYA